MANDAIITQNTSKASRKSKIIDDDGNRRFISVRKRGRRSRTRSPSPPIRHSKRKPKPTAKATESQSQLRDHDTSSSSPIRDSLSSSFYNDDTTFNQKKIPSTKKKSYTQQDSETDERLSTNIDTDSDENDDDERDVDNSYNTNQDPKHNTCSGSESEKNPFTDTIEREDKSVDPETETEDISKKSTNQFKWKPYEKLLLNLMQSHLQKTSQRPGQFTGWRTLHYSQFAQAIALEHKTRTNSNENLTGDQIKKKINSIKGRYVECRYLLNLSGWGTRFNEKNDTMQPYAPDHLWKTLLQASEANNRKYRWHRSHYTESWSILQFLFETRTASGKFAYHPTALMQQTIVSSDEEDNLADSIRSIPFSDKSAKRWNKHSSGTHKLETERYKQSIASYTPSKRPRKTVSSEVADSLLHINESLRDFNKSRNHSSALHTQVDNPLPLWHQAYYMIAQNYPSKYESLGADIAFKLVDFLQYPVPGVRQSYGELLMFMRIGPFQAEFVDKICRELKEQHEKENNEMPLLSAPLQQALNEGWLPSSNSF